ncbi:response regulator transcription factor, partial [Tenacibaculum agarivorans]|uniref:response regulator transcription factor n=1 Tax=Tenacibaculum agarivorans TaxID=1908389 RepID=UPI00094BAC50
YCDKALSLIKKAELDNNPFELIITDLSFDKNYGNDQIKSGEELINAIKKTQQSIKIIVYSVEDRAAKVKSLFSKQKIDGYVAKDGFDAKEILNAIDEIHNGKTYISKELEKKLYQKNTIILDDYSKMLSEKLSKGYSIKEIQKHFSEHKIAPYSISSIEKRLEKLKLNFEAKNNSHLIAILKDFGLL